jgi:hypothetical protein
MLVTTLPKAQAFLDASAAAARSAERMACLSPPTALLSLARLSVKTIS